MKLENDYFNVTVLPAVGGKITSILFKPDGHELLWKNPAKTHQEVKPTDVFDDIWSGGWDEVFPNDIPEKIKGKEYIDHGELWYKNWDLLNKNEKMIQLKTSADITGAEVTKEIQLFGNSPGLSVKHKIENLGEESFPYSWKVHPAFNLDKVKAIELPADEVIVSPEYNSREVKDNRYNWPYMRTEKDEEIDMRIVPGPDKNDLFFQFARIKDGWFKLLLKDDRGIKVTFNNDFFPYITLFLVYGGWNDYYTAVIEPSTSIPDRLSESIENNTAKILENSGSVSFSLNLEVSRTSL